jgi:CheY-like chemotaxis protein
VPPGKKCALLVDDEELIIQVGQEMLYNLDYDAVIHTDSAEALEIFRAAPQRFNLVITDYDMPHMTGDILAHELRGLQPDVPIILCTGSSIMTSEKARTLGFDALLRKPFGSHDMALAIQEALARRTPQKI